MVNWKRRFIMICVATGLMSGTVVGAQESRRNIEQIAWLWDKSALPGWSQQHAAVLVEHIHLTGDDVRSRPRLDGAPLLTFTRVTPVVHVEVSTVRPPVGIERSRARILKSMHRAADLSTSGWVQLDMEVRPSQRFFYHSLVRDIKADLPPTVQLSVTALAWWCRSPAWIDELAADEVVPMVFRMGKDAESLRRIWSTTPGKLHPRCRHGAVGQAMQEPLSEAASGRYSKIYSFDAKHWRR